MLGRFRNYEGDACASFREEGPGGAGAHHMVAGATSITASVKGSLRRPPAALDPRLLRQLTHRNPRCPLFVKKMVEPLPIAQHVEALGHEMPVKGRIPPGTVSFAQELPVVLSTNPEEVVDDPAAQQVVVAVRQ